MLNEIKDKSYTENCFIYFPFFNHKLYENPSEIQEEEYLSNSDSDQNLEDSSTNISHDSLYSIDDEEKLIPLNLLDLYPSDENEKEEITEEKPTQKEIQPELQKYILPKSLFCTNKNKKSEIEDKNGLQDNNSSNSLLEKKLDLTSQPYMPKYKVYPVIMCNHVFYFPNENENKFGQPPLNYCNYYNCQQTLEKKKKKKKVEFVEREGDWSCYRCKNINFSFRDKCNKCQLSKDESEKKFVEVGEALLKLADSSIYEKK